jgi:3-phenylpropionate/cinnamic acid dioxygenase small subunit
VITNVEVLERRADRLSVASALTVVATRRDRQSVLYGRYRDELHLADGTLSFQQRVVTLENNLVRDGKITFIV